MQTFGAYAKVTLVQPTSTTSRTDKDGKPVSTTRASPDQEVTLTEQVIAVGPAASQIAIKQLGTNGGGFFNVNSAHPFENPTPLSNFLEMLAILLIPAALCYTFGVMVGDTPPGLGGARGDDRHLRAAARGRAYVAEQSGNPVFVKLGVDHAASALAVRRQHGRQGGPLRHRQLGALGRRRPPRPRTARSTRCTTRSRRSAGWCRCG